MVPDQTPQNAASNLSLILFAYKNYCLNYNKNDTSTPDTPYMKHGLIHFAGMEESTRRGLNHLPDNVFFSWIPA